MKKLMFLLIQIFISSTVIGQEEYGVIADKDGYTNVREDSTINSKIKGKILEGEIFCISYEEETKEWQRIFFMNPIKYENNSKYERLELDGRAESLGYIHKSRIKKLITTPIELKKVEIRNEILYYNDSIEIKIGARDFRKEDHKIEIDQKYSIANRIDNESVWGTDGELPRKELEFIEIKINNVNIKVSDKFLIGFYEPNIYRAKLVHDSITNSYLLIMYNSDGAGFYESLWQIKNNRVVNRYAFMPF